MQKASGPTPDIIRGIVKDLTGVEPVGVIEYTPTDSGPRYLLGRGKNKLVCIPVGDYWMVTSRSPTGSVVLWHNDPDKTVPTRGPAILRILELSGYSWKVELCFLKEFVDIQRDIRRTTYETLEGRIELHSARVNDRVECFLCSTTFSGVIAFVAKNGSVDSASVHSLVEPPF